MEFPDLGKNCSNLDCRQLDFLPVICDACSKVFCVNHYQYDNHSCPNSFQRDKQVPICPLCNKPVPLRKGETLDVVVNRHIEDECQDGAAVKKRSTIFKNRCTFENCKKRELVLITCDSCRSNFCLKHRHPLDHKCSSTKRDNKNPAAGTGGRAGWSLTKAGEAALRRMTASTSTSGNSVKAANPKRAINPNLSSSARLKSVQGDLTEDEALAQALQQSINEQASRAILDSPVGGDQILRETIERSQRESSREKNNCSVT